MAKKQTTRQRHNAVNETLKVTPSADLGPAFANVSPVTIQERLPSHVSTQEEAEHLDFLTNEHGPSADVDPAERLAQDAFAAGVRGDAVFVAPRGDHHPQHHANRYAVTLNVGLINNPWRHSEPAQRTGLYRTLIDTAFGSEGLRPMTDTALLLQQFKPATATYRSSGLPSAFVTEDTDVITFDVYSGQRLHGASLVAAIKRAVHYIAFALNQEAVAAYYVDEGARDITEREETLLLAGPWAVKWGAPDFARFQKFDGHVAHSALRF